MKALYRHNLGLSSLVGILGRGLMCYNLSPAFLSFLLLIDILSFDGESAGVQYLQTLLEQHHVRTERIVTSG